MLKVLSMKGNNLPEHMGQRKQTGHWLMVEVKTLWFKT